MFTKNTLTKLSALAMKSKLSDIKKTFDASEYGGAPLLGISKPVIKAHGSSDAFAIKNAVKQAINYAKSGAIRDIARYIKTEEEKSSESNSTDQSQKID
jgi:glycerol-3-phosphate acyltransferase PlsX